MDRQKRTWDHPRLRGEHFNFLRCFTENIGSPPPTRGTHPPIFNKVVCNGITPAYAGNTLYRLNFEQSYQDHPRLRGEHKVGGAFAKLGRGSPPPTRGTPGASKHGCSRFGITPRLRGEHLNQSQYQNNRQGSPPPTRGTHKGYKNSHLKTGITPAYAGNTYAKYK